MEETQIEALAWLISGICLIAYGFYNAGWCRAFDFQQKFIDAILTIAEELDERLNRLKLTAQLAEHLGEPPTKQNFLGLAMLIGVLLLLSGLRTGKPCAAT